MTGIRPALRPAAPHPPVQAAARPSAAGAPPTLSPPLPLPVAAAAVGALLLWSGTSAANKIGTWEIDPLTVGLLRSALAGLVALAVAVALGFPFPRGLRDRLTLVYAGLASFCLWPGILSLGIGRTSATHAVFLIALIPIFTGLFANGLERRAPRIGWWLGAAVAVAGAGWLVSLTATAAGSSGASLSGDLIILAGAAICASGYVAGGRLTPVYGTWSTTFWSLATTLVFLVPPLILLAPQTDWGAVGVAGWGGVAYLTLGSSLAGYALWFWALGKGGIARIGSWQFAMPVAGVAIAALTVGEAVTWRLLLAGAVILLGTVVAQRHAA